MRQFAKVLGALAILSACGSASETPLLDVARATLDANRQSANAPGLEAQKANIVRVVKSTGYDGPVLMVALPKRQVAASMIVEARNGDAVTWRDATGVTVVTRRGVVIATRGLGHDVMASDVSGTLKALDRVPDPYRQLQRFLDGEGHLQNHSRTCTATHAGSAVTETCSGTGDNIINRYELRGGTVMRSRQWLGTETGYAEMTRIQ